MNEPAPKTVTAELSLSGVVDGLSGAVTTALFVLHAAQKAKSLLPDEVDAVVDELVTVLTEAQKVLAKV